MKKYGFILSSVFLAGIILLILVVEIREDYYTLTTEEVHDISVRQELVITSTELKKYQASSLLVHLCGKSENDNFSASDQEISINPSDLLLRKYRKLYAKNQGVLILSSEDIETAAKAWVILNRKGYRVIKILDDKANEKINYSFQPDSTIGPKE